MIKQNSIECKKHLFQLAVIILCIIMLAACGGGGDGDKDKSDGNGDLTFNLAYYGEDLRIQPQTAVIDCTDQGVDTVEVTVYGPDGAFLIDDGPWECDVEQITISDVPAGSGRVVVALGKDAAGNIMHRGEKTGIDVQPT